MADDKTIEKTKPKRKSYRPGRVAIATDSGKFIDACFGRTDKFLIYELRERDGEYSYEFLEARNGPKPCRDKSHDQSILEESARLLTDCGMVLSGKIGPGAVKALSDRGIMGIAIPLEIDDALKRLSHN
jgi:predicted Fe-Mo cluster-binding NifX family protein